MKETLIETIKDYISEYEAEKRFAFNKLMEAELNGYPEEEMWQIIYNGFSSLIDNLKRLK